MNETAAYVLIALLLAGASMISILRATARPGIIDRQEKTLTQQHNRMDTMQREIDELRVEMQADREELNELRLEMAEWRSGMQRVFEQMKIADITPVWTPRDLSTRRSDRRTQSALARRLLDHYNIDELNSLAYEIGITADEIPGDTIERRARELVELAARRGIVAALITQVNIDRGKG